MSSSFTEGLAYLEGTDFGAVLFEMGQIPVSPELSPSDALVERAQLYAAGTRAPTPPEAPEPEQESAKISFSPLRMAGFLRRLIGFERAPKNEQFKLQPSLLQGLRRFETRPAYERA